MSQGDFKTHGYFYGLIFFKNNTIITQKQGKHDFKIMGIKRRINRFG